MPIPVATALDENATLAVDKATAVQSLPRYLASAALAGVYVGIAVVLLISVSAPLVASGSGAAKLVQAGVFGLALTLVVFAGAELFTGNVMVMLQGWWRATTTPARVATVLVASLAGNIAGSIALAAMVHAGGTMSGPAAELVTTIVTAKDAASGPQLFWRAVLCNALVCLALWMAARTRSDAAKLVVLWWALLGFIGSGFEHSIANVTTFSLAALDGSVGWGALVRNLVWTVPGNVVGGGLVVGLGYAWITGRRVRATAPELAELADVAGGVAVARDSPLGGEPIAFNRSVDDVANQSVRSLRQPIGPGARRLVTLRRDAQRRPVHLEAEILDLMSAWIERYRRQAEQRYRRLDDVRRRLPDDLAPVPSRRRTGAPR